MDANNLANAFSVWAAVVGLVGFGIVFELSRLRTELKNMAERLNQVVVEFEHRLTAVESAVNRIRQ